MKRLLFLITFICALYGSAAAQQTIYFNFRDLYTIKDYKISDRQDRLLLVALDTSGNVDRSIQGKYSFVVNGFIEDFQFKDGEANITQKVDGTTFLYIKHENKTEEIYKLFFFASGTIIPIPLWSIVVIFVLIVILAFVIRKFIMMGIVLFLFVALFLGFGLSFSSLWNLLAESASAIFK